MPTPFHHRLIFAAAGLAAVYVGYQVANGDFILPAALAGLLVLGFFSHWARLQPDVLVGAAVLFGYLVGNRGFAQLHAPSVPLLPGEAALAVGAALLVWRSVLRKSLPLRQDALNVAVLIWLLIGAFRLFFDFRAYGLLAVRDSAMVYYAVFFFLGQDWMRDAHANRVLDCCLSVGFALAAPMLMAFVVAPEVVAALTTVSGSPLVFVKTDSAGGMLVAGSLWFIDHSRRTGNRWWLICVLLSLVGVLMSNSRAALVAFAGVVALLALGREWRRLRPMLGFAATGMLVLVVWSLANGRGWGEGPIYRLYESVVSMTDPAGQRQYRTESLGDKGDNNTFRMTWWHTVINETNRGNPVFGLGFGYDLAEEFTRIYYAEGGDDFTARSPHNFLISVYGRMGIVGLTSFAALLLAVGLGTWRSLRLVARDEYDHHALPCWLGAWAVLITACFGVVMEGPMGATLFWILLGMAHGRAHSTAESEAPESENTPEIPANPTIPTPAPVSPWHPAPIDPNR